MIGARRLQLAVLLTAAAASASAAEVRGALRLAPTVGIDSNPNREYTNPAIVTGPFAALGVHAQGELRAARWAARGSYELGGRGYLFPGHRPLLTNSLQLDAGRAFGALHAGLEVRLRDRRGLRSYTDLQGAAILEVALARGHQLRIRAGARRFLYPELGRETFTALELGLAYRWRLDRHHQLALTLDDSERLHVGPAQRAPGLVPSGARRRDRLFAAGAAWTYRGPFAAGASYLFAVNASNSYGERAIRHRFQAHLGLRLPWELTLMAQATGYLTDYLDGLFLSEEVALLEDEENANALTLKLVKPISDGIDLELRAGWYGANFANTDLTYTRYLTTLGLAFTY